MYKVYFKFYNAHTLNEISIVCMNATTDDVTELLPLVNTPINNFFHNGTDIPISTRLKLLFTERNLIRYLVFVNENYESNVCFTISKILSYPRQ